MPSRGPSVTIHDVAHEAGVSKSTAARVLSGHGSASPNTQHRVHEAAQRLGYRPNGLARAIVSGTSNTIAVLLPDVANAFFSAALRGLTDSARAAGFEVLVSNTDNDADIEARSIELLTEKRADGFIIAPVFQDHPTAISRLVRDNVPVVLLDRRMPALADVPLVSVDHIGAADRATSELIERGHRDVAIVTEAPQSLHELRADISDAEIGVLRPSTQRLMGYRQALDRHGITLDEKLVVRAAYSRQAAHDSVAELLESEVHLTALFCTDAILTAGAYKAISERKVDMPGSLSFVGFDDQEWTTLVDPTITVMDQPRHALGSTAATRLLAMVRDVSSEMNDVRLPASLVVRGSTGPPPGR